MRWKPVFLSLLALAGLLASAAVIDGHYRQRAQQRQQAAWDKLLLPSQSLRRLPQADTLRPAERDTLFQHHDLGALLRNDEVAHNGFYGSRRQRLEVFISQATQHLRQPGTYQLQGFTRVAGSVRRVAGTVRLRRVRYLTAPGKPCYTALGTFALRQYAVAGGRMLASWRGLMALDFSIAAGRARYFKTEGALEYNSRGLAFEGIATGAAAHQLQPVLWAEEFLPLAKEVLRDFTLGGRSLEISPKYRRYGWADYYRNDEWWADLPGAAPAR